MKRLFLYLMIPFFIFSATFLHGQTKLDLVDMALITGSGISWMSTDDNIVNTNGLNLTYKIHVLADYALNERFSITGGVGLSLGMGGKLKYDQGGNLWSESKIKVTHADSLPDGVVLGYAVNYLDFPIGFKMKTREFGKYRFFAHLPELSIGLRTRARGTIEGAGISTSKEQIKEQVHGLNLSWGLGVGTDYFFSDDLTFTAGIRFFQSISDITDDSGRFRDGTKENSKALINNIDLRFGIIF